MRLTYFKQLFYGIKELSRRILEEQSSKDTEDEEASCNKASSHIIASTRSYSLP